jgi:hypothetical protein
MQIVRVYTGADGESHFEDVTPEQFAKMVNNLGDGPSPGDVLMAEDLTGHGYIARSIGEEFRVSLAIPLADGSCCAPQ